MQPGVHGCVLLLVALTRVAGRLETNPVRLVEAGQEVAHGIEELLHLQGDQDNNNLLDGFAEQTTIASHAVTTCEASACCSRRLTSSCSLRLV